MHYHSHSCTLHTHPIHNVQSKITVSCGLPWHGSHKFLGMALQLFSRTGSKHDYLFCYCPLVGILFEVLRIGLGSILSEQRLSCKGLIKEVYLLILFIYLFRIIHEQIKQSMTRSSFVPWGGGGANAPAKGNPAPPI